MDEEYIDGIYEQKNEPEIIYELADRGERFIASIIDGLVITIPAVIVLISTYGFSNYFELSKQATILFTLTTLLLVQAIYIAINGWLLYEYGQTVGKKIMDIKIVNSENKLPPLSRSYGLRYFIPALAIFVPFLGRLFQLVDALFIFREDRRCIHDLIAGTRVIKK